MDLKEHGLLIYHFMYHTGLELNPELRKQLSHDELERAGSFRRPEHTKRFLLRRAVLRTLLAQHLEVGPRDVRFVYGPIGKPSLAAKMNRINLHFNTSSSGEHFLIALRRGGPVGVDVVHQELKEGESVATRILSDAEQKAWTQLPEKERATALSVAWARKEALLKASGVGLQIEPSTLDIGWPPIINSFTVDMALGDGPMSIWSLLDFRWDDAVVALCIPGAMRLICEQPDRKNRPIALEMMPGIHGSALPIHSKEMGVPR